MAATDPEFPCSLVITVPLPTHRLASSALRALQVDAELSPLVQRSFTLVSPNQGRTHASSGLLERRLLNGDAAARITNGDNPSEENTILRTEYKATTNRMLRVSVNGFLESMGVVLGVMEELDVDVLAEEQRLVQG
ncbi:MAG: hypothetical protein Q9184_001534 [Pyrenodesmia sp. 2 TL-2023]